MILSCCIIFPLTFGWLRFTLAGTDHYQLWFFGLPMFRFAIEGVIGFLLFHGLDITAVILIVGLGIALKRRLEDVGLRTTQCKRSTPRTRLSLPGCKLSSLHCCACRRKSTKLA